jgi:phage tail sheath protein FI
VQLTYPGVYVQEIPSSVRPIATVSTSIGAFVDSFKLGPVDQAVQIFGMADFERIYGGVASNSPASYQIAQFFLNGGPSAWVVRVAPGGKLATTVVKDTGATKSFTATASSAGTWGNDVRLSVEPVVVSGAISATTFNLAIARYATGSSAIVTSERQSSLSKDTFVTTVNDSSQLVTLTVGTAGTMPAVNGTLAAKVIPASVAGLNGKTLKANTIDITLVTPVGADDTALTAANVRAMLESALRIAGASQTPPVPALVGATVSIIGGRVWVRTDPRTAGYKPTDLITLADGTATVASIGLDGAFANVQEYALGITTAAGAQDVGVAGDNGGTPDAAALIGDELAKSGLYALENADLFNILCLPAATELSAGMTMVFDKARDYCERRRAMFIVDIPATANTPATVQKWLDDNATPIASPNVALYFPRVEVPDPTDGYRLKSIGNSGTIAGIWAKTDNDRGVWKAPAGIDAILRGVAGLDYLMSDGENGALNPLAIDCLRNFPVYGQVVWGARTLYGADARASEWKYIPIRRLALMIEESLFRGTKWVVFEPNDEPLWAKIRQNIGAFMTTLFRQGAFQGSTPDKAFFVKCDGETTTAADRNLGVVNIEVGFAPLKPAEFVVLKIQQIPDLT